MSIKLQIKKCSSFFKIFTDGFGGIGEDRITLLVIDLEIVNSVFNQSLLKNRIFLFFHTEQSDKNAG